MIVGAIQPQSLAKYNQKFNRWKSFCDLRGQGDYFLEDLRPKDKLVFVCAWAAWAREGGKWCGHTVIQGLAAVRTLFIQNLSDHEVFESETIKQLRRSLNLTDYFSDAKENPEGRLPFGLDMVRTAALRATTSDDKDVVMLGTAIVVAFVLMLRIGEYGECPKPDSPDHRLTSNNVAFYVRDRHTPLTPSQLKDYSRTLKIPILETVRSVSITLAGSKTDKKRQGVTFSFEREDFDMDDETNAIAMLTRWACLTTQADEDPFFSYRPSRGGSGRVELTAEAITKELRSVAVEHHFEEKDLYRFTPHSLRIGMATHLHNMGITNTVILQMGRWSPRSTAAPRYQQLGRGACAQVARTTRTSEARLGQSSEDTIKTLTHVKHFRDQYKKTKTGSKKE